MLHARAHRLIATGAVAAVAGAVLLGTAAPAFADTSEVWTENVRWFGIDSDAPYIEDAESAYADLLGSGVALPYGWTGDAFDGVLYSWEVSDGDGASDAIDWTAVSESVDSDGLWTWTYAGTTDDFVGATFSATLELQGSTARWMVTPTGTASGLTVSAYGNLGSDGSESVTVVTPNSAVVSSDDDGRDPVLGYWFDAPSGVFDLAPGDGGFEIAWDDSAAATIVIALQDYAACAETTAIDEMVALVPTLGAQFGLTIEGALDCLDVATPTALAVGAATSQTLAMALDPAVDALLLSGNTSFGLEGPDTYFGDAALVGSAVVGLPAGLTGTIDPATQELLITGTPTVAGTFAVSAIVYRTDVRDYAFGQVGNGIPLVASFTVTVTGPVLPATGAVAGDAPIALAAGFLLIGGLALGGVAASRRRA